VNDCQLPIGIKARLRPCPRVRPFGNPAGGLDNELWTREPVLHGPLCHVIRPSGFKSAA
jgi:hypothetical protein